MSVMEKGESITSELPPKRKTRDSCDACAKSKVRCGKQHPRCDRCVARNKPCNYGFIRPRGRRRLSQFSTGGIFTPVNDIQNGSPHRADNNSDNHLFQHIDLFNTLGYQELEAIAEKLNDFSATDPLLPNPPTSVGQNDFQLIEDWQTMDQELERLLDITTPQPTPTLGVPYQSSSQSSIQIGVSFLSTSSPSSVSSPSPSVSSLHGQSCITLTFKTLQTLHAPSEKCVLNSSSLSPRSLDAVLYLNQKAMSNLSLVIGCPCSLDFSFAPLIAQVISNILVWYQAILDGCEAMTETANMQPTTNATLVRVLPIKIGQYELSEGDHRRIVTQMVLNDLNKLRVLVDSFTQSYCRREASPGDADQSMCSILESVLRRKLDDTLGSAVLKMTD
ncbi:uncharacterized protein BP01DRAFT_381947 [Aspergillus saccharolyticus JOP 1030-1]|uniref:Zn(2)-C6 fungal-type domain-containing protein n=1 Tax=Aspergillus saccharolyticus JOP 1030-1 TaxID=1450539 RepID=A0A318ZFU8_9EURO|nr:hypothetical protein BP01DRAFT_381947 [Aspergillus saccharolyticus JOP 1030-1]PYH46319.1 hypothetical protein BP01DRAFT_381947 [Aspergillus saccharolyticus JOP 1030-1]